LQRRLPLGNLADLIVIDSRIWGRDEQAIDGEDPTLDDPERSILGADQEAWLASELETSPGQWKLIGQQVVMGQLPQFLNTDQWDGYPAARERLFTLFSESAQDNVVVLTGDIHASGAMDLTPDPFSASYQPDTGAGSLAVELVVPAVTSQGFPPALANLADALVAENPHFKFADLTRRGYVVLDITPERVQGAWYHVDTIEAPSDSESLTQVAACYAGTRHIVLETEAAPPPADIAPPAP
jgi:alkaline phosphatase D